MVGKLTPDDQMSASVLPQIVDQDYPFGTPNEALRRCLDAKEGKPSDFQGNEQTHWGNLLEKTVLIEGASRLALKNYDFNIDEAFEHPDLPLACSLDGKAKGNGKTFVTDVKAGIFVIGQDEITLEGDGVLECKVTANRPEPTPPLWRGPIQLQGQMMCVDAKWGAIATLYGGNTLYIYLFSAHPDTQMMIADKVVDFDRRLNFDPVQWYDIEHQSDPITLYPTVKEDQPPMILPANLEELAKSILVAKEGKANFDHAIKNATMAIQAYMGNHDTARCGNHEIKWGMRHYEAKPEHVVPAKPAYSKRVNTLTVKEL